MLKKKEKKIIIPYQPQPLWEKIIHPNLESHRFSVIVAHRRFGKTVGTVNHIIKQAIINPLMSPMYAYVAPYRNQAKLIAWKYLKYYTDKIPGRSKNESDLFIEFPSKHKGAEGAKIYVIGADNPDNLRGTYWDGVILDEYAQIKPSLWDEVIRPALSDRKGWANFIGTPKGQNQFYEIYKKALKRDDWYCCMYRADESGVFDPGGRLGPEELKSMMADMSEISQRQELFCDFTASATNILITIDLVNKSLSRVYQPSDIVFAPKILGVDVARYGDDSSVITRRQGLVMYPQYIYKGLNNMDLAARVMQHIDKWQPDAVFIDAGRGEGVIDRCRQMGYYITEVNFASQADKPAVYKNKRTEMFDEFRQWMEAGGSIPDDPQLKTEVTSMEYSFDAANRMVLESKDTIKEKLGFSPDRADSGAITFAYPVAPKNLYGGGGAKCNTDYELFS